jgi:DNA-directed RNA polymerase specialized sigma24 family protein
MAHVKGMTQDQIAAALGISEKRVEKRLTAALRGCRERLVSHGIDMTDVLGFVTLIPFAWALTVH